MRTKNTITILLGFSFYFLLRVAIFPWDNHTSHRNFNDAILQLFEINFESFFSDEYSINMTENSEKFKGMAVTNPGLFYYSYAESEVEYTTFEWIKHGGYSADEPEVAAAVRHFYDPIGLNHGKKYLTNRGTYWEEIYTNPHIDAISWAMNGSDNNWSLSKGKNYFRTALEEQNETIKSENLAKALRCLGEVLHNTADMGCPAHVRNDSHASISWHLRKIFGSPDATEELFTNNGYVAKYMDNEADEDLENFFNNANTIRSIHEKLAEFTNANFFTTQTMNGPGINPINNDGNYPNPSLKELEYNSEKSTYYKTAANGSKIKMAKDYYYWVYKGYPYIDQDCVNSQAGLLVPNIIWAGINVVRLFIPIFEVSILSVGETGEITGIVNHIPTEEYPSQIKYSGKIKIYNSEASEHIAELDCNSGNFSGNISNVGVGKVIYANLEIAGIEVRSKTYKIGDSPEGVTIDFRLNVNMSNEESFSYGGGEPWESDDIMRDEIFIEGSFTGNTFSGTKTVHNVAADSDEKINYTISITLNSGNNEIIESFSYTSHEETIIYTGGHTYKNTYVIDNIIKGKDFNGYTSQTGILRFTETDESAYNVIDIASRTVNLETIELDGTYWHKRNSESTDFSCDSESYIVIKF